MGLSDVGEFGLIKRFRSHLSFHSNRIGLGIGDDGALIKPNPAWETIFTIDTLVEHVHYDLSYTPFEALGWKALAVNLSDVAAMGGLPVCAIVSLGISDFWTIKTIDDFYQGLNACSHAFQCPIVGGDTVRLPRDSIITITVIGEVESGCALKRSGARPGDYLCVTGPLGDARSGMEVLTEGNNDLEYNDARTRFLKPVPRIYESRKLLKHGGVTSMIDISDGLSSEIHHICRESHVGCRIFADRVPIASSALRWIEKREHSILSFVMESGEEYELLFTIQPEAYYRLESNQYYGISTLQKIGDIRKASEGVIIEINGETTPLNFQCWDHFHQ
ncbi:thiamine-phosphate kinase [bacterium]|nr:thiamine-phosphate kinase [bacterium]